MNYEIDEKSITIFDSYQVKKAKDMQQLMLIVMSDEKYEKMHYNRDMSDYIAEWKVHNWCYNLHIFRKRTKDVNLDRMFPKTFRGFIEYTTYQLVGLFFKKYNKI